MKNEYPKLMVDSTNDKDGKAETMLDYVLSWCLRRAESSCKSDNKPILYGKCCYMLGKLLDLKEDLDEIEFTSVKTWKQWKYIDLCVEVEVLNNGKTKKHAILIENKYYTGLRKNQLENYRKHFDSHYKNQEESWELHYALVCCYSKNDPKIHQYDKEAAKNSFTIYPFYDLVLNYDEYSESDIYNEFWIRW